MTVLVAICALLLFACLLQLRNIAKAINVLIGALTLLAIGDEGWEDAA